MLECINSIIGASGELKEEIVMMTIDGTASDISFETKLTCGDGAITFPMNFSDNMYKYDMLLEGRFWTEAEQNSGKKVVLIPDLDGYTPEYSVGDELLIADAPYEIIGVQLWANAVMLPVTVVPDDAMVDKMSVMFDSTVSTATYNKVRLLVEEYIGEKAIFKELETIDKDTYYVYKTVMLIAIFIALVVASNFMILYRYILSTRKKTTAIYRILGLTSTDLSIVNLSECMILIVPFFVLGMLIYRALILPGLQVYFKYINDAYNPIVYLCLFVFFIVISLAVIGKMINSMNKLSILTLMKDRG